MERTRPRTSARDVDGEGRPRRLEFGFSDPIQRICGLVAHLEGEMELVDLCLQILFALGRHDRCGTARGWPTRGRFWVRTVCHGLSVKIAPKTAELKCAQRFVVDLVICY